MKNLLIFALVALIAMSLAGCRPQIVEYPINVCHTKDLAITEENGNVWDVTLTVWEPVLYEGEDFAHPAAEMSLNDWSWRHNEDKERYKERYIMPFVVKIKNDTAMSGGTLEYNLTLAFDALEKTGLQYRDSYRSLFGADRPDIWGFKFYLDIGIADSHVHEYSIDTVGELAYGNERYITGFFVYREWSNWMDGHGATIEDLGSVDGDYFFGIGVSVNPPEDLRSEFGINLPLKNPVIPLFRITKVVDGGPIKLVPLDR